MSELYRLREYGKYTVVKFDTPTLMNSVEVDRIRAEFLKMVDVEKKTDVVLDFTGVQFFSSQVIGLLLTLRKRLTANPATGSFTLCGVGPQLLELLRISRLDRILTIKSNYKEAVRT